MNLAQSNRKTIVIPDWQTNCVYLAACLRRRHPSLWRGLLKVLAEHKCEVHSVEGTRDIWIRDFMPIQVATNEFVKFRYEPDYLRVGHRRLITEEATCRSAIPSGQCETSGFNIDGGNVVASEMTAILTTKVFKENPQVNEHDLLHELRRLLRVEQCIMVPREPGDLFGHADGMLRFLDEHTVLVNDYSRVSRAFGRELFSVLGGHGLTCEPIPYFVEEYAREGVPSAVGCYINFLRVGSLVVVPVYGMAADERALNTLEIVLPGHTIVPLQCTGLARAGGVLHCVSWTIRDRALGVEGTSG